MLRILSQMLKLPIAALVYSMEMMVKTMRGLQAMADESVDLVTSEVAQTFGSAPEGQSDLNSPTGSESDGVIQDGTETMPLEETKMADIDLSNDRVKVVEYYILSIEPDNEHILGERDEIEGRQKEFPKVKVFTDSMTGEDFASWVIAEWFQDHPQTLEKKNKKYVRVCYDQICSFDAEESNYDREEVQVLRQIARSVAKIAHDQEPSPAGGGAGGGKPPRVGGAS